MRTKPVDRRPPRLGQGLALVAGLLGVLAAGVGSGLGAIGAGGGLLVLGVGLGLGSRRAVSVGALALLGGLLYAGLAGAPPAALLVGVAATTLAWDLGGYAIDLGAELGREAVTWRPQVLHATASLVVATTVAGVGYGIFLVALGGQTVIALLLLLLGGLALVATLDYS